ncbi:MAG: hypothetical protein ACSLE1_03470 [Sphingobium sp.]
MDPELVAPAAAWLAHESCTISGDMMISMAGRVARAYVAETKGVYHPDWTIEQIGEEISAIREVQDSLIFPPVPSGHLDHLKHCFAVARTGYSPCMMFSTLPAHSGRQMSKSGM